MNELLLLSIKSKYANQIFEGTKKFEFRKKSIGENNCNKKIYIYSSEKDKAIIGYIIVDKILKGSLDYILENTNSLNDENIIKYFENSKECYALHIKDYHRFAKPIKLETIRNKFDNFTIPQFYRYIRNNEPIYEELEDRMIL